MPVKKTETLILSCLWDLKVRPPPKAPDPDYPVDSYVSSGVPVLSIQHFNQ
jgi:hypothetical protein